MKNALIIFGAITLALMSAYGMSAIQGQTGTVGVQHGFCAPTDLTLPGGLLQSLYGSSPFVLTADEEEEEVKPDIKEEELTPGPDRTWCCQYA